MFKNQFIASDKAHILYTSSTTTAVTESHEIRDGITKWNVWLALFIVHTYLAYAYCETDCKNAKQ